MDRNLGADAAGSAGLYYQWGRKDPFDLGHIDFDDGKAGSIQWAHQNPTTFYLDQPTSEDDKSSDWLTEGGQAGLWSDGKTVNDPCPAGWKVPSIDKWDASQTSFTNNSGTSMTFLGNTYPYSGYVDQDGNVVTNNSDRSYPEYSYQPRSYMGGIWSNSYNTYFYYEYWSYYRYTRTYSNYVISHNNDLSTVNGMNVRCVKQ